MGDEEMKDIVDKIYPEIVLIRRELHMHPELSENEYETMERISSYLDRYSIEHTKGIADTGICAIIRGKERGRTVAARADIDALPIIEDNDLDFKSKNQGVMHACGHDVHTAIHLGVARFFKEMESDLEGNVKIFFQPAEETVGGAARMIDEGVMEDPRVDYIVSLHVHPGLSTGRIELKPGKFNASTNEFEIIIEGKSGHAAYPEKSIDPILIAGYIIVSLQSLVSRNVSPLESVVLTIGKINGGVKNNVIPERVVLSGTLRTLDPDMREYTKNRIVEIVENTALAHGGSATVEFDEGYPSLINDEFVTEVLRKTAEEHLGKENVILRDNPSLGADDFSYFTDATKGCYYNLGCADPADEKEYPIHHPKFQVDEACIKTGMLLQVETLKNLLKCDEKD
jgi:amidohydrolase